MKRLLLPLLAALALPTAVNAETLNLECKIKFRDSTNIHKFRINLSGNDTKITRNNKIEYAESMVDQDEILILYREDSPDSIRSFYTINRVNGNLIITNKVNKYAVEDPYYDKYRVEQLKNFKPTTEKQKILIDALLTPQISAGKCKKVKKVKTMF